MELLKSILTLITSFFQSKTAKSKEEVTLADKTEEATVEKIRASENAKVVQQQQETQKALDDLHVKQTEKKVEESKKPLDEQLDNQFGSDE